MHEADILDNDKNGKPAQGYYDAAGDTVNSVEGDPTVNSKHVTNHVWNPSTLAWEKMAQPVLNANNVDLTGSFGDVEALLAENYWKDERLDYDDNCFLIYKGYNIVKGAATSAATWYLFKYIYNGNFNLAQQQGPIVDQWDNRTTAF